MFHKLLWYGVMLANVDEKEKNDKKIEEKT